MFSKINTVSFSGVEVKDVWVEVQISSGLPKFSIVGLADKAVNEAKERIQSAFSSMGLSLPPKRITVNLAPADLIKAGSHFDLPIAVGLLSAMEILEQEDVANYVILGELGLDGAIAKVAGVLPAAVHANSLDKGLICPSEQGSEALWSGNEEILAPGNLISLINHFKGNQILSKPKKIEKEEVNYHIDFSDIKGQEFAKRAMEVAAAGGHNLLMVGSPGSGKSMMAERFITILPPMSMEETLEVSMIHSIAGTLDKYGLVKERPYQAPHHSASLPAMTGGGANAKPGEISLAHRGILFLDELVEFQRSTLEALRQPLESGKISISRAKMHVTYPANFQLIAAMNPCKCGHLGNPALECHKAPKCAVEYQNKLSGPLLDRIDMHIQVDPVSPFDITENTKNETSEQIRERVIKARERQLNRMHNLYKEKEIKAYSNSEIDAKTLDKIIQLTDDAEKLIKEAYQKFNLTARSYHRTLKVALTIADLAESNVIDKEHIAEALTYRRKLPGKHSVSI
jgi:magnesium chelatase family protein